MKDDDVREAVAAKECGAPTPVSQTPTSLETGGRNALNLQVAQKLCESFWPGGPVEAIADALRDARSSVGKEQETPRQLTESASLQMALQLLRKARCPNPHDVPTPDCPWCLNKKALLSENAPKSGTSVIRSFHCVHGAIIDICDKCNAPKSEGVEGVSSKIEEAVQKP
jgi:hypothetical protein